MFSFCHADQTSRKWFLFLLKQSKALACDDAQEYSAVCCGYGHSVPGSSIPPSNTDETCFNRENLYHANRCQVPCHMPRPAKDPKHELRSLRPAWG